MHQIAAATGPASDHFLQIQLLQNFWPDLTRFGGCQHKCNARQLFQAHINWTKSGQGVTFDLVGRAQSAQVCSG